MGKVLAVCINERKKQSTSILDADSKGNNGFTGDVNFIMADCQINLLPYEKIAELAESGMKVEIENISENVVVEGVNFKDLQVGNKLKCGDAVFEVADVGKKCNVWCTPYMSLKQYSVPIEGIFVSVLKSGVISPGDELVKLDPQDDEKIRAAVITLSDKGYRGEKIDKNGPLIAETLQNMGYVVEEQLLLSDDREALENTLKRLSDMRQLNLVITAGGTGFSKRDNTPEATLNVAERNAPGIAEAIRAYLTSVSPMGMLTRGVSVIRGKTLIINLPGNSTEVKAVLNYIMPAVDFGIHIADGTQKEWDKFIN